MRNQGPSPHARLLRNRFAILCNDMHWPVSNKAVAGCYMLECSHRRWRVVLHMVNGGERYITPRMSARMMLTWIEGAECALRHATYHKAA